MNQTTAITSLAPSDTPALRALLERIGWADQYVDSMERAAIEFAARADGTAFAAREDNDLRGFCLVEIHHWNTLAQIQGLAVDPDCRRQGAASALVAAAERWARAAGARGIYVDTPVSNQGGRAFYRAAGYVEAYVMPRYYEDDLDGLTLQKFFASQQHSDS